MYAESCPVSDLSMAKNFPSSVSDEDKIFLYLVFLPKIGYLTSDDNVKTFWYEQQLIQFN
jgi:hypothetical protein